MSRTPDGTPRQSAPFRLRTAHLVAALATVCAIGPLMPTGSHVAHITLLAAVNIVAATGLNLINGHTGQFSLGHAGFMAVGAYTAALITLRCGAASGALAQQAIFGGALAAAGLVSALAGLAIGLPSLRLRGDYLAIVTLGFAEIIRVGIENTTSLGGASGITAIPPLTNATWAFAAAVLAVYAVSALVDSTYGRGFVAVRDDEVAAGAMGVDTTRCKVTAFVAGAAMAGVAGALYAHLAQTIAPEAFRIERTFDLIVMVILGGMGNTIGVVAGAVLLTVLPEAMRYLAGFESLPGPVRDLARNRMLLYAVLLIALMLARPQGLFRGFKNPFARR